MELNKLNKLFVKFFFRDILPLIFIFIIINKFFGPPIYRMNDDAFIAWLLNAEESEGLNKFTVYTGYLYGLYLQNISSLFSNLEWHGITQIILIGLNFAVLTFFLSGRSQNKFLNVILRISLYAYFGWYLLSPTYTMTATTLGIVSFLFLYFAFESQKNIQFYLLIIISFIFQAVSYQIRPESFYMSIIIITGILSFYLWTGVSKSIKFVVLFFNMFFMGIFILIDKYLFNKELEKSRSWASFFEFNASYSEIKTNPGELDLYKKIGNNQIPEMKWNYSDALLFQVNAFYNQEIFSSDNLAVGIQQVRPSLGISGILDRGFQAGFERMFDYLHNASPILVVLGISSFLIFLTQLTTISKFAFVFMSLFPTAAVFFYLGAGSRLPLRVYLPVVVFLSLFTLIFILFEYKPINKVFTTVASLTLISFSAFFVFSQEGLLETSSKNRQLEKERIENIKIMQNLNPNGIFIGQIEAFHEHASYAYINTEKKDIKYLTSGWFTFSPIWYLKLYNLNLLKDDVYLAIAQQENVYWVSNPYTAEILNIFMNDREILRKNMCQIVSLNNGLKVYTYQSEIACDN